MTKCEQFRKVFGDRYCCRICDIGKFNIGDTLIIFPDYRPHKIIDIYYSSMDCEYKVDGMPADASPAERAYYSLAGMEFAVYSISPGRIIGNRVSYYNYASRIDLKIFEHKYTIVHCGEMFITNTSFEGICDNVKTLISNNPIKVSGLDTEWTLYLQSHTKEQ